MKLQKSSFKARRRNRFTVLSFIALGCLVFITFPSDSYLTIGDNDDSRGNDITYQPRDEQVSRRGLEKNKKEEEETRTVLGKNENRTRPDPTLPDPSSREDAEEDDKGVVTRRNLYNEDQPFSMVMYGKNDIVSDRIIRTKSWESPLISKITNRFLQYSKKHNVPLSDLTFLDVGANIGWFTMNMAALGVQVLAFEPMAENIALIKKSLALPENIESGLSSRVQLHTHALGVKNQTCYIVSDNNNFGDGHTTCLDNESDFQKKGYSVRGKIEVRRLDDVVSTDDLRLVVVKMDTEGYEANVLAGGSNVLLNGGVELIQTEYDPRLMKAAGGDPVDFIKKFAEAGYQCQGVSKERMISMAVAGHLAHELSLFSEKNILKKSR